MMTRIIIVALCAGLAGTALAADAGTIARARAVVAETDSAAPAAENASAAPVAVPATATATSTTPAAHGTSATKSAPATQGGPTLSASSIVSLADPQQDHLASASAVSAAPASATPASSVPETHPAETSTPETSTPQTNPPVSKSSIPLDKRQGGDVTHCLELKSDKEIAACADKHR